ncbi:hypothetical protein RIF29_19315 [Crotalaria pallida]|uniref:Uncharacterized protein n=1 Tax=Crotalaria pallida TaxID=3830 RepID=A0AAN9I7M3_CROPI
MQIAKSSSETSMAQVFLRPTVATKEKKAITRAKYNSHSNQNHKHTSFWQYFPLIDPKDTNNANPKTRNITQTSMISLTREIKKMLYKLNLTQIQRSLIFGSDTALLFTSPSSLIVLKAPFFWSNKLLL